MVPIKPDRISLLRIGIFLTIITVFSCRKQIDPISIVPPKPPAIEQSQLILGYVFGTDVNSSPISVTENDISVSGPGNPAKSVSGNEFTIYNISSGTYTITVAKTGYLTSKKEVTVSFVDKTIEVIEARSFFITQKPTPVNVTAATGTGGPVAIEQPGAVDAAGIKDVVTIDVPAGNTLTIGGVQQDDVDISATTQANFSVNNQTVSDDLAEVISASDKTLLENSVAAPEPITTQYTLPVNKAAIGSIVLEPEGLYFAEGKEITVSIPVYVPTINGYTPETVEVGYYNTSLNSWETYEAELTDLKGYTTKNKRASFKPRHFSEYTIIVNGVDVRNRFVTESDRIEALCGEEAGPETEVIPFSVTPGPAYWNAIGQPGNIGKNITYMFRAASCPAQPDYQAVHNSQFTFNQVTIKLNGEIVETVNIPSGPFMQSCQEYVYCGHDQGGSN